MNHISAVLGTGKHAACLEKWKWDTENAFYKRVWQHRSDPVLEPSSCASQPTAEAPRRNELQISQLVLLPPGFRAAWAWQEQTYQLKQGALWDADRLQHCCGSSVSDSSSPPLHDLISPQLSGSNGISVLFGGLSSHFSQSAVQNHWQFLLELSKWQSLSQKHRQYCFVSAFEGARQICQWKMLFVSEKCYFNLRQLATTSYVTAFWLHCL